MRRKRQKVNNKLNNFKSNPQIMISNKLKELNQLHYNYKKSQLIIKWIYLFKKEELN